MSKRLLLRGVFVVVMAISLSGCIQEPVSTSQKVRSSIPSSPSIPKQPVNHSQKKTEVRRYNEKKEEEDNKLTIIENFDYYKAKVLQNPSEIQVYWALVNAISSLKPKIKVSVCPQAPLGSYIGTPEGTDEKYNKEYRVMASLRPDFVIVTNEFYPIAVVEFNGGGHDSKNDHKKRLVLKKVGIPYIEISDFKKINNSVKSELRHYIEKEVVPIIVRAWNEREART